MTTIAQSPQSRVKAGKTVTRRTDTGPDEKAMVVSRAYYVYIELVLSSYNFYMDTTRVVPNDGKYRLPKPDREPPQIRRPRCS